MNCDKCKYSTDDEIKFKIHIGRTHRTCKECGYIAVKSNAFKRPLLKHERNRVRVLLQQRVLLHCSFPDCNYSTKSKKRIENHHKIHRTCKECGYHSLRSVDLNNHMLTTHGKGDRTFPCGDCNISFYTKKGLREHEKRHKNPIKCDDCNFITISKYALKKHKNRHLGIKNYHCDFPGCDMKFVEDAELIDHKNRHLGIKDYHCDFPGCDWKFVSSSELTAHKKRQHTIGGQIRQRKQENRVKTNLKNWGYTVDCETTINAKRGNCLNDTPRYFSSIDFHVINCTAAVLLLEVDEQQHLDYLLPCEFSRMADVQASLATVGITKPVYWIRYNPNGKYHVGGEQVKIGIKERESELKKKLEYLCSPEFVPENKVNIHYMFYDLISEEDGPELLIDPGFPQILKEFVSF